MKHLSRLVSSGLHLPRWSPRLSDVRSYPGTRHQSVMVECPLSASDAEVDGGEQRVTDCSVIVANTRAGGANRNALDWPRG